MFDLEKEIQAWCESIHPRGWNRHSKIAEFADHLHCEIERLMESGLTEEEAFLAATQSLGSTQDLTAEHLKNRSLLSIISEFLLVGSLPSVEQNHPQTSLMSWRSLLPTICFAISVLLGGLFGAFGSSLAGGSEAGVIASYVVGFLVGATIGTVLALRIASSRKKSAANHATLP